MKETLIKPLLGRPFVGLFHLYLLKSVLMILQLETPAYRQTESKGVRAGFENFSILSTFTFQQFYSIFCKINSIPLLSSVRNVRGKKKKKRKRKKLYRKGSWQ